MRYHEAQILRDFSDWLEDTGTSLTSALHQIFNGNMGGKPIKSAKSIAMLGDSRVLARMQKLMKLGDLEDDL